MAFFTVTSLNRLAVRKLLTAAGMDSADVRKLTLSQLGVALHDRVSSGVILETDARNACESKDGDGNGSVGNGVHVAVATGGVIVADDRDHISADAKVQDAIKTLLGAMGAGNTAKVDESQVRDMVVRILKEENAKPAVIEIRTDGEVIAKLDGKRVHSAFATLIKVVSTRVGGRRLHVWIAGPSGSGKSVLAAQLAEALKLNYYSTGAVQSKYDLIGHGGITGDNQASLMTPFRIAFEKGGVFAMDDIDASSANAFAAFNEALANGRFAFPDRMVEQHPDFVVVASANTWGTGATAEYVGRNRIDAATLTRFVRVMVGYDEQLERDLVGDAGKVWAVFVQKIRASAARQGVKVLITPRHTLQGAALLQAGLDITAVERMTVYAGLDEPTIAKLAA